jgi:hypothetical protein
MLNAKRTITVANRSFDPAAGTDVYCCHILRGCSWYARERTVADGTGLKTARTVLVRIPLAAGLTAGPFYEPAVYASLPAAQRAAAWTLAPGDRVLLGEVSAFSAAEAARRAEDCFTVTGHRTNLFGPLAHWCAEGSVRSWGSGE